MFLHQWLVPAILVSVASLAECGNYTVTEEAWFDIEIKDLDGPGEDYRGRFVVGLFGETTPMTAMNFASLAKGFKRGRDKLQYKNSYVHRVVQDFVLQMGDITMGDGTGGRSIYGDKFVDENFILSHRASGYTSMANHGRDSNSSQFFVLLSRARWLDGQHVVFGKVVRGMDVVRTIGNSPTDQHSGIPKKRTRVVDSGVMALEKKYDLTEEQAMSDLDVEELSESNEN